MNRILKYILITVFMLPAATMPAQVTDAVEEALLLMRNGSTTEAIEMLNRLGTKAPKDGQINILLGDCARLQNNSSEAIEQYKAAQKKGVNDAWLKLADLATLEYRIDDAEEDIELYRKGLKKGRKTLPDESEEIVSQLEKTKNMLARVEKIVIIDSLTVDTEDFFKFYRLSPESGTLTSPLLLPDNIEAASPTVVYTSESGMEQLFAMPDDNQVFQLVSSPELYGGARDVPHPIGSQLNEGGDANYPFLMPDGITLYFANDGKNSLGGYDIFVARKSGNEYLQPQNIGMPYNSPFNDYMLAIDETTGVGWWATDRNQIPGKVTIYVFIPSELRNNYSPDDPNLASRARIDAISDTWEQGADYSELLHKIKSIIPGKAEHKSAEFMLSVPGRGVISSYEQFNNHEAAREMRAYIELQKEFNNLKTNLASLRKNFSDGDRSVADKILKFEQQIPAMRRKLKDARNRVIKLEQN